MRNLNPTYTVDKCIHPKLNGEHTELFDLSKLTEDDIEQYVLQTLVIRRQGMLRGKNADKIVLGTWVVPEPGKRIPADPVKTMEKAVALVSKLTEEQKMEIAKSMGFAYVPQGIAEPSKELEAGENVSEPEVEEEV